MAGPIKNPGGYSEREGTNVRLEPNVKEALGDYLKTKGMTMADYFNELVKNDLASKGAYTPE
jgi:hypothetical protein